jgi:hypothetical protein
MKVITDTHNLTHVEFDSMAAVAAAMEALPRAEGAGFASTRPDHCKIQEAEAIQIAANGARWPEGSRKLKAALGKVDAVRTQTQEQPLPESSPVGFMPVVPNALQGLPDAMLAMAPGPAPRKALKIGVHVGRNFNIKDSTVFNRAAAVLTALDILESSGIPTELWAVWRNAAFGCAGHIDILVKAADMQWDIDAAAFAFGCPATQRRLCWGIAERFENNNELTDNGYGSASPDQGEGFDIFFPRLVRALSEDSARDMVTEVLRKAGIALDFEQGVAA